MMQLVPLVPMVPTLPVLAPQIQVIPGERVMTMGTKVSTLPGLLSQR